MNEGPFSLEKEIDKEGATEQTRPVQGWVDEIESHKYDDTDRGEPVKEETTSKKIYPTRIYGGVVFDGKEYNDNQLLDLARQLRPYVLNQLLKHGKINVGHWDYAGTVGKYSGEIYVEYNDGSDKGYGGYRGFEQFLKSMVRAHFEDIPSLKSTDSVDESTKNLGSARKSLKFWHGKEDGEPKNIKARVTDMDDDELGSIAKRGNYGNELKGAAKLQNRLAKKELSKRSGK